MTVPGVTIRPAGSWDLTELEALPFCSGLTSKHRLRFSRQVEGDAMYLLACRGDRILGHLYLKWHGPDHPHVRSLVASCAEIEDFVVDPEERGRGIGSAMIDFAGRESIERGIRHLGLAVGDGNPRALAFYQRNGFTRVPGAAHRVTWIAVDENDRRYEAFEDCTYLIKELA
jgi:ribosomal protein S18 acetylase RimI-like enzyme